MKRIDLLVEAIPSNSKGLFGMEVLILHLKIFAMSMLYSAVLIFMDYFDELGSVVCELISMVGYLLLLGFLHIVVVRGGRREAFASMADVCWGKLAEQILLCTLLIASIYFLFVSIFSCNGIFLRMAVVALTLFWGFAISPGILFSKKNRKDTVLYIREQFHNIGINKQNAKRIAVSVAGTLVLASFSIWQYAFIGLAVLAICAGIIIFMSSRVG